MTTVFGTNVLDVTPPTGPVRLWDAQTEWARIEKERGVFDWSRLDALVAAAGKRNIMIVLGHPPAWAARGGSDGKQAAWMPAGSNRPPIGNAVWVRYVTAVVTRYKGRVSHYQVWNEPVDKRFYSGTFAELASLSRIAYAIIKKIDPSAKVVSTPLQPRRQAGWSTKGQRLIEQLKSAGCPFDIWAMHIYPQQTEGIEGFVRDCKLVIKALEKLPKKPLWITEINYNLGGVGNPYPAAQQEKLKKETRVMCDMLDIKRAYWYAFNYNNPSLLAITNF